MCLSHIIHISIMLQPYADNVNVWFDTTQLPLHDAVVQQLLSMLAETIHETVRHQHKILHIMLPVQIIQEHLIY